FAGNAERFSAMALPPGMIFNTETATLSGTPTSSGNFLVRFTAENGFSRVSRLIPIHVDSPKRFADWRNAHFLDSNDSLTGPLDDPDGDSVENLLEYALHRNPTGHDPEPPTRQSIQRIGNQDFLALTYDRLKSAFDL